MRLPSRCACPSTAPILCNAPFLCRVAAACRGTTLFLQQVTIIILASTRILGQRDISSSSASWLCVQVSGLAALTSAQVIALASQIWMFDIGKLLIYNTV